MPCLKEPFIVHNLGQQIPGRFGHQVPQGQVGAAWDREVLDSLAHFARGCRLPALDVLGLLEFGLVKELDQHPTQGVSPRTRDGPLEREIVTTNKSVFFYGKGGDC